MVFDLWSVGGSLEREKITKEHHGHIFLRHEIILKENHSCRVNCRFTSLSTYCFVEYIYICIYIYRYYKNDINKIYTFTSCC